MFRSIMILSIFCPIQFFGLAGYRYILNILHGIHGYPYLLGFLQVIMLRCCGAAEEGLQF